MHFNVDYLLLTKLDDVDLLDDDLLRAIGSICPNLKHVVFKAKDDDLENDPDLSEHYSGGSEDEIDPTPFLDDDADTTEVESPLTVLLNRWPKVSKTYSISLFRHHFNHSLCFVWCLAYNH